MHVIKEVKHNMTIIHEATEIIQNTNDVNKENGFKTGDIRTDTLS